MRNINSISASTLTLSIIACGCGGAGISPELRTARNTIDEAKNSQAIMLERGQLRRAEATLEQAERAEDGSFIERDLAYVADRQARIAMADANLATIRRTMEQDERQYHSDLERAAIEHRSELQTTEAQLAQVRAELAGVRGEMGQADEDAQALLQQREQQLAAREQQLMAALAAYADAEMRAQEAMAALEELASVREEGSETIVTISGELLFEYNQSQLRPTARQRLQAVVDALKANPSAEIVVEGHTDSVGSDEYNQQLSQRRAEAVRQFLVDGGIEMNRVRAVGRGEQEPIAENDTDKIGRAHV